MEVKTVTVIGANGTMGCNVSAIFASFGGAKVYMVSRTKEKSEKAAIKAAKSVRADSIRRNLIPVDYSSLASCIKESDLVFESVAENMATKLQVTSEIARYINEDTICATGTSGLSITTLAEVMPGINRKNYMGMHFYNPPYSMTLCEVTTTNYTDQVRFNAIKEYLDKTLYRTVVEVKDLPAFLGNRIGFQLINEALIYAERYKYNGGIDYIDAILGQYTGRSMAPLVTSDYVGLDVHKAIVDNIYQNTTDYAHETFIMPAFAVKLVNEGKLGRKAGGGLYKMELHDNGAKRYLVYDIVADNYRDKIKYSFPFAENMISSFAIGDYQAAMTTLINNRSIEAQICLEFILKYVIYALNTAGLVGYSIHAADDVMATGFNWCPPLAVIDALSGVNNFKNLVSERLGADVIGKGDLDKLLSHVERSTYDYRRYFKAVK